MIALYEEKSIRKSLGAINDHNTTEMVPAIITKTNASMCVRACMATYLSYNIDISLTNHFNPQQKSTSYPPSIPKRHVEYRGCHMHNVCPEDCLNRCVTGNV